MFCALCGDHARHPKSPEAELRRKECPRFAAGAEPGVVHRGCCAREACSETDSRGHVRCGWARGGKERHLDALKLAARGAPTSRTGGGVPASAGTS